MISLAIKSAIISMQGKMVLVLTISPEVCEKEQVRERGEEEEGKQKETI